MVGACVAGGMHGRRAYMVGVVHGGRHARQGACVAMGGGACMAGETATAVGSMHPTGMHSCWRLFLVMKQLGIEIYEWYFTLI